MFKLKFSVILVVLSIVVLFAGCSSGKVSGNRAPENTANALKDTAGITNNTTKSAAALSVQQTSRRIEKSASLSVETLTYDKTISKLESLINQYSGYIESSTTEGLGLKSINATRTANYTMRILQKN